MTMSFPCCRRVCVLVVIASAMLAGTLSRVPAGDEPDDKDVPRLILRFQDKQLKGKSMGVAMRFGLQAVTPGKPAKNLTFDPTGWTNNTCLKIDGDPRLFGTT